MEAQYLKLQGQLSIMVSVGITYLYPSGFSASPVRMFIHSTVPQLLGLMTFITVPEFSKGSRAHVLLNSCLVDCNRDLSL